MEREDVLNELNNRHVALSHQQWREEFETNLTNLAKMCDPNISAIKMNWTNYVEIIGNDYKAAISALINYGEVSSRLVNVEGDSPHAIVSDVWRQIA